MKIYFDEPLFNQEEIQGVYVIYDGGGTPVYCGQSSNIKGRLGSHRSWVGDGYYAEIIHYCCDKKERFKIESSYHNSHQNLISKPTNGRQTVCKFDGISYVCKRDMYDAISGMCGMCGGTIKKYIEESGCDSLATLMRELDRNKQSLIDSVSLSNVRRTGVKLNMKLKLCPHCGVTGRGGNMTRYHFDNCKEKL